MKRPVILITRPMYGSVSPRAVASFNRFLLSNVMDKVINSLDIINMYIDFARNDAVRIALGEANQEPGSPPMTHVLYVDSDMTLPVNGLDRMLEVNKPVVGGLYFSKTPPYNPVVFDLEPFGAVKSYKPNEVYQVDCIGTGFLLVQIDVFRKMREHFKNDLWFASGSGVGEDVHFMKRLQEMGVPVYLDARVICGHVGEVEVTPEFFTNTVKAA